MSMRTRINTLERRTLNKIIAMLYANNFTREDVDLMVQNGRLSDVADVIDIEELF